jgi:HEAT repeat protein
MKKVNVIVISIITLVFASALMASQGIPGISKPIVHRAIPSASVEVRSGEQLTVEPVDTSAIDRDVYGDEQDIKEQKKSKRTDEEKEVQKEGKKEITRTRDQEEALYDRGTRALDQARWDRAVEIFGQVVELHARRTDGALYWKAYAQNKLGQRTEALAGLAELNKSFPQSRWINDAKALEVEIQSQAGRPVSPGNEGDEDLKLMAINGLLNSDPDQAIPLLEKILTGNQPPKIKERALFVLSQSGSPKAREIIGQIARGQSNPDLQRKAVQYLGLFGGKESHKLLADIYASSSDVALKKTILRSFMTSGERGFLLEAAKGEKNPELRLEAIRQLGVMGGQSELWEIFQAELSVEIKEQILHSMFVGGSSDKLIEVARNEKDPKLRRAAIHSLGLMGGKKTGEALVAIYTSDKDLETRKAIVQGLFVQGNAKALVELARKETDPAMKKQIVQQLSVMGSKEATDYLMEIINK